MLNRYIKRVLDTQIELPLEDRSYSLDELKQILDLVLNHLENVLKGVE